MQALKSITGTGPVVTQTNQLAANQLAKVKGKPDLQVTGKPQAVATTATQAVKDTLAVTVTVKTTVSPEEVKKQVAQLLIDLRAETDSEEKKKIRRKLRLRGHFGGLGERAHKNTVKDDGRAIDISASIKPATTALATAK